METEKLSFQKVYITSSLGGPVSISHVFLCGVYECNYLSFCQLFHQIYKNIVLLCHCGMLVGVPGWNRMVAIDRLGIRWA